MTVGAFAVEHHPVPTPSFAEFVAATGYVTVAEQRIDAAALPGGRSQRSASGAMVCLARQDRSTCVIGGSGGTGWWGQNWRHPFGPVGPDSTLAERADHPVVQVAYPETPRPMRGGPGGGCRPRRSGSFGAGGSETTYAWGDEAKPGGQLMANTWEQAGFRYRNDGALGSVGTSPVGTFPPNGFGLVDMIGNVWEWTATEFSVQHRLDQLPKACCAPSGHPDPDRQPDTEGRFAPVRAGVLPPLPSGCTVAAIAGHRDYPYRVSLCGGSAFG